MVVTGTPMKIIAEQDSPEATVHEEPSRTHFVGVTGTDNSKEMGRSFITTNDRLVPKIFEVKKLPIIGQKIKPVAKFNKTMN